MRRLQLQEHYYPLYPDEYRAYTPRFDIRRDNMNNWGECRTCSRKDRPLDEEKHFYNDIESEHPYYQPRERLNEYNR